MKVLVTGAGGQLGRAVVDDVARRGLDAVAASHADLPVEDAQRVRVAIRAARPDLVVHCAAWTDVDGCEGDPERALLVNGRGAGHVAAACRETGAALVHVSTDYVFAGDATRPYRPEDATCPRSAYGRSKLAGEEAVLEAPLPERFYVVRTSWVFGPGGRNFPAAILARARAGGALRVVDDQIGSPTMTRDLAAALVDLGLSEAGAGVYHAANEGTVSWHGFAVEILRQAGIDAPVGRMASAELERPAPRPAWSALDCAGLTAVRGRSLPPWQDALQRYLAEETST